MRTRPWFVVLGLVLLTLFAWFLWRDRNSPGAGSVQVVDLGHGQEVRYASATTEAQARAVGDSLRRIGYGKNRGWMVKIEREGEFFEIWFPVDEGTWDDEAACRSFEAVAIQVSQEAFDEAPLVIRLCDGDWNSKRALPAVVGWGRMIEVGKDEEVFFQKGTTEAEARAVARSLTTQGYFGQGNLSVQIGRDGDRIRLSFAVPDGAWDRAEASESFRVLGLQVSRDAFAGRPVVVHLCDAVFRSRKELP